LESVENRNTHAFAAGKLFMFSNSDLPALQIFANLFLAESRKNNGLKVDKGAFFRAATPGFDKLTNSFKRAMRVNRKRPEP
jgi:hypothetical protein